MPRQARLDTPGTLHHVIVRGIEKRRIFYGNADREDLVKRLGSLSLDTDTTIYAWAFLPNHAHILLRSSKTGISLFMRRLLTGYAISFNKRHRRWGHLFQNRFKSIVCDEDAYFKELVRYIHLNPLRANLVESLYQLDRYPWCGHGAILGNITYEWQDREYVLRWFAFKPSEAKHAYRNYVQKGIAKGRRPELVGGGLIRSMGGWSAVKSRRHQDAHDLSDERILGDGKFVERIMKEARSNVKFQLPNQELGQKIDQIKHRLCQKEEVSIEALEAGSRRKEVSAVRARIAIVLVRQYGVALAEAARNLGVSTSAISKILKRAEQ
jgi:REP element-mobilizing transposase RayT